MVNAVKRQILCRQLTHCRSEAVKTKYEQWSLIIAQFTNLHAITWIHVCFNLGFDNCSVNEVQFDDSLTFGLT